VTGKDHKKDGFHRKRTGLNHVAFRVLSGELVDRFVSEFLGPRSSQPLYGGAKKYPEYVEGCYAVYFEDPDRIKIEVVYEPPPGV
jgi:catechol 2,3-dioxygenase-like lactoylglutathione lyase family enzyme